MFICWKIDHPKSREFWNSVEQLARSIFKVSQIYSASGRSNLLCGKKFSEYLPEKKLKHLQDRPILYRKCRFWCRDFKEILLNMDRYHTFVLGSGDGDYAPVIEELLKREHRVFVVSKPKCVRGVDFGKWCSERVASAWLMWNHFLRFSICLLEKLPEKKGFLEDCGSCCEWCLEESKTCPWGTTLTEKLISFTFTPPLSCLWLTKTNRIFRWSEINEVIRRSQNFSCDYAGFWERAFCIFFDYFYDLGIIAMASLFFFFRRRERKC